MKAKVLVSGASGIVGYGILRSLAGDDGGLINNGLLRIGTSIYEDSVAPAFCEAFELAPRTDSEAYIEWLLSVITRYQVDLLIPGIEADMIAWSENRKLIEETGARLVLNKPDLVALCKDKWLFFEALKANGIQSAIPSYLSGTFDELSDMLGLPFLLKPRRGFGAKGIVIVGSKEDFDAHRDRLGDILMAQPIVGKDSEEYTSSVFGDGEGGYYAAQTLRRELSSQGFTEKAEVVDTGLFESSLKQLCALFKPIGPTNFQYRLTNDGEKLLEINPRVSSSTSIRAAFGYNESLMSLQYFLKSIKPSQPSIRRGKAVRYTEEHVFYDDSLYL